MIKLKMVTKFVEFYSSFFKNFEKAPMIPATFHSLLSESDFCFMQLPEFLRKKYFIIQDKKMKKKLAVIGSIC